MIMPLGPYACIGEYQITYGEEITGFFSLVSKDNIVAWMPDNEQQHSNPLYRDYALNVPLSIWDVSEYYIAKMLKDILSIKTKNNVPLETILKEYDSLIRNILNDFKSYRMVKK